MPDAEAHLLRRPARPAPLHAAASCASYDELLEAGDESDARSGFLDAEIAKGSGSDTAAMFFTSGTTGAPKGVVLTHDA